MSGLRFCIISLFVISVTSQSNQRLITYTGYTVNNQDSLEIGSDADCHCGHVRVNAYDSDSPSSGGGCRITTPPPEGWKCICEKSWGWQPACRGRAMKCAPEEHCPARCASEQCCRTGGGNCKGYSKDAKFDAFRKCIETSNLSDQLIERSGNVSYYDMLNHQWNFRLPHVLPLAYFLAKSTTHVQMAVKCGVQTGVKLIPNSGGHSAEGLCFGKGDSVIVDLRLMNSIAVHPQEMTANIQPGALLGQVLMKLWASGGYAAPFGACLTVGAGGHILAGGDGYYAAMYGTALDNVLEMTIVDAKGIVRVANARENSDLYWAFKGVGQGYFGIVTEYKIKIFDAKLNTLSFINLHYDKKHFLDVMVAFQKFIDWVNENEPSIAHDLTIIADATKPGLVPFPPGVHVNLLQIKNPTLNPVGNASFLAAMDAIFPKEGRTTTAIYNPSHIEYTAARGYIPVRYNGQIYTSLLQPGAPSIDQLSKEIALQRYDRVRSFFVRDHFSRSELQRLASVVDSIAKDACRIQIMGESGFLWRVKPNATNYVHRDSIYQFISECETLDKTDFEAGLRWLDDSWAALRFMDGGGSYQGLPDLQIPHYLDRYYGSNLQRLESIKKKYDPNHYFNQRQSIPVVL